ncbi:MAG: hypothetical protein M3Z11_00200 [Candidatus Dormibacteraeota bacterium]|nr:hypothetical protein [Candidatus Dormibacteraeota bacterium]
MTGATFTGESPNIRHQMASYRNPGPEQLTNQRLGALLKTFCATAGVIVLLEIVASARSKGNAINLESPGHRALLERALRGSSPGASLNL